MDTIKNLPLTLDDLEKTLIQFSQENNSVLDTRIIQDGRIYKLYSHSSPYKLTVYNARVGLTLRYDEAQSLELLSYIMESIKTRRLQEERITFQKVNKISDVLAQLLDKFEREQLAYTLCEELDKTSIQLSDPMLKRCLNYSFYNNGTLYINGYNTPLFDSVYNYLFYLIDTLPKGDSNAIKRLLDCIEINDESAQCTHTCSQITICKRNPIKYLNHIHFDHELDYSCEKVIKYYFGRYIARYSSEIAYTLKLLKETLRNKTECNLLSLGCGSSPELFAFNDLFPNIKFNYFGIDRNQRWDIIHVIANMQFNGNTHYTCNDIFAMLNTPSVPNRTLDYDFVFMQYLISTLLYTNDREVVTTLLSQLKSRIFKRLKNNSYVILCDINNGTYFVDFIDHAITNGIFDDFEIDLYTFPSSRNRYITSVKQFASAKIIYQVNKEIVDTYGTSLECNAAIYIMRKKNDHQR